MNAMSELEDEKYLQMQELKGQIALLCMQFQSNIDGMHLPLKSLLKSCKD